MANLAISVFCVFLYSVFFCKYNTDFAGPCALHNNLSRFTPGGVNQDRVDFKEIEPSPDSPQGGVNRYIWCNQITAMKQIQ